MAHETEHEASRNDGLREQVMTSPPAQDGLIERLRKMAKCIHIAVDATVAADIDEGLTRAADRLAAQAGEIARLKRDLDEANEERAPVPRSVVIDKLRDRAEAAEARAEHLKVCFDEAMGQVASAQAEAARLRAELAAVREDAERYRWLREQDDRNWNELFRDSHEGLDTAIDLARKP